MAKLNCPKCPDFDGFAMCTSQPLSKVASYEWCRKYLEGLEEVNGTITLSTDLFLRLLRKAYSDAYYGAYGIYERHQRCGVPIGDTY